MEDACSSLEFEFRRIQNDLEFSLHRLQTEFREREGCPDVVSMIRRIHELERKIQIIQRKTENLTQRRAKVMEDSMADLINSDKIISSLHEGALAKKSVEYEDPHLPSNDLRAELFAVNKAYHYPVNVLN